jgi:hypothetical protein
MRRDISKQHTRSSFIELAINDKDAASKELKSLANSLKHCKNTTSIIRACAYIFGVSEATIWRDYQRRIRNL